MAKKEHLKKATPDGDGGLTWTWKGQNGVTHSVHWNKAGETTWTVLHEGTVVRTEQPWFLVKARGEVQENIRHYRNACLDTVLANRGLISVGLIPDQHIDQAWCICARCDAL